MAEQIRDGIGDTNQLKVDSDNAAYVKLIGSDGNPVKIAQVEENRLGSECNGSDGATGRVLTLANTSTSGGPVSVWVEDQLIS